MLRIESQRRLKLNGMTVVGVLYGYGSETELRDAGAHHVCATPRGLLEHTR